MARMTSIARTSRCLCAALLLVPWAAAHPANAALRLAASGLRLRDGAAAHGGAALSLGLRGGGAVPGVTWSQRQDSLMVKVEIPAGASLDALRLAGDDDVIEWADDAVSLSLDLYAKLDKGSLARTDGGRQVTLNVKKADPAWWPKLTKGPKPGNVKVDWASWKDEDEAETEKYATTSVGGMDDDFDFGSMAGGDMAGEDLKAPSADAAAPKKWVDMDDDGQQEGGEVEDRIEELDDDKPENEDLPDAQNA